MEVLTAYIPVFLYFSVGIISAMMAVKNLSSGRLLPFQEKAAGKSWEEVEPAIKPVLLALLRVSGLGFLVVAILLLLFPIVNYFSPGSLVKYAVPCIALLYCSGLFLTNYQLYKKTGAKTPWKGSLYAICIIITGLILSLL
jgi:hypothetical protein